MEIKKVYINEDKYPEKLKKITDAPNPLYYAGDLELLEKTSVAVVGSRRSTQYGRWVSRNLGKKIAEADGTVVSGMAAGIDTCAHWGAIDAAESRGKVSTVAVLGCGLDICYPEKNRDLYEKIAGEGLLISEYPPGTHPTRYTFPKRNRIISGVSDAVVVVQAPDPSGALITAGTAADQGRDVYAVPGNINSEYNFGSNKLIRDGAIPLIVMDDILEDLGLRKPELQQLEKLLGKREVLVLGQLLNHGEMTADQLSFATGITVAEINGIVTVMEMKGIVCTSLGKIFIAK